MDISIKICFKAPAPAIISKTIVIPEIDLLKIFIISSILVPLDNPSVYIDNNTDKSISYSSAIKNPAFISEGIWLKK